MTSATKTNINDLTSKYGLIGFALLGVQTLETRAGTILGSTQLPAPSKLTSRDSAKVANAQGLK